MICLILTYGVPNDNKDAEKLRLYAQKIGQFLGRKRQTTDAGIRLVMNGGATNPFHPETTETEALLSILKASLRQELGTKISRKIRIKSRNRRLDLEESLREFTLYLNEKQRPKSRIVIFCEYWDRHRVRYLAERTIDGNRSFAIVAIDFDEERRRLRTWIASVIGFVSAILHYNSRPLRDIVRRARPTSLSPAKV